MGLTQGIELKAAIPSTIGGKDRDRFLCQDKGIWIVIDKENLVLFGEVHEPLVKLRGGTGASGHIRIIDPHQLDTLKIHVLKLVEIRKPAVLCLEVVGEDLTAGETDSGGIRGIAGIRHEDLVAGVDESQGDQQYTFLGSHKGLNPAIGIQSHTIITGIPVRKSLAKNRQTLIVLILMTIRQCGGLG